MRGSLEHKRIRIDYKIENLDKVSDTESFNPHVFIEVNGLKNIGKEFSLHI
jgi:hypothetical protein